MQSNIEDIKQNGQLKIQIAAGKRDTYIKTQPDGSFELDTVQLETKLGCKFSVISKNVSATNAIAWVATKASAEQGQRQIAARLISNRNNFKGFFGINWKTDPRDDIHGELVRLKDVSAIADFSVSKSGKYTVHLNDGDQNTFENLRTIEQNQVMKMRKNYLDTCTWITLDVPKEFVKLPTDFFTDKDAIKKVKERNAFYWNGRVEDGELPRRPVVQRVAVQGARDLRWKRQ